MPQENVEIVREAMRRFSAGDYDGSLELIAQDAIWEPSGRFVGSGETYPGHSGIQRFWADFTEPWETITLEPVEVLELGDVVLTDTYFRGVGRASAIPTEMHVYQLWTVRERKIVRFRSFADRAQALEAAGLED